MKTTDLRQLSIVDLKEQIAIETSKYEKTLLGHRVSPIENPAQLKYLRRNIARMKTILGEMERAK